MENSYIMEANLVANYISLTKTSVFFCGCEDTEV